MRLASNFILFTIAITLFSCKENNHSTELLGQAQSMIESNPDKALILLDSINNPQKMDIDSYMQYLVANTRAKQETKADIVSDTLIFEAQRYFYEKDNYEQAALANYYAAWVNYKNKKLPQSLESFMNAAYFSQKQNNSLLAAKSYNNIGYVYYQQDLLDSAIVNYQRALMYFNKSENTDDKILVTYTYIGRAFEESKRPDSAYLYYNKALKQAIKTNNEKYQSFSLQNLGVLCYNMQDYDKAIHYYKSALSMPVTNEEHIRKMNIGMLIIYNKKKDPKSVKQYTGLILSDLPKVTYNYTIKEIYAALAEYYRQTGDLNKALEYRDLEQATKEQIEKESNASALLDADKNFYLKQKEREAHHFRVLVLWSVTGGGIAFLFLLLLVIYDRRDTKRFKQKFERQAEKYDSALAQFRAENEKYPRIEAEIKSILEEE